MTFLLGGLDLEVLRATTKKAVNFFEEKVHPRQNPNYAYVSEYDCRNKCVFSFWHRRSQDFVWGALFAKKVDDFFSRRLKNRLNIPLNLSHPAKTVLKIDSCSGWGCTSCPGGALTTIFFTALGRAGAPTALPGYAYGFWRNVASDMTDWMSAGRLYQSRGPAAAKERSPTVTRRYGRTSRRLDTGGRRALRSGRGNCAPHSLVTSKAEARCRNCVIFRHNHAFAYFHPKWKAI